MRAYLSTPGARVVMPAGPHEARLALAEASEIDCASDGFTSSFDDSPILGSENVFSPVEVSIRAHGALAEALAELIRVLED